MTHRPAPAVLWSIAALLLNCLVLPAFALERVEARLSSGSVPAGQPVELTLSASSDGASLGSADLSVLEPDFQVVDRRVERRYSVNNGRRSEEIRLRLMILPRRDGALRVPSIPFGSVHTEPLALTVEPGAVVNPQHQGPAGGVTGQPAIELDPRLLERPQGMAPTIAPPDWRWGMPPGPEFPTLQYRPFAAPLDGPAAGPALDPPRAPETTRPAPDPAPAPSRGTAANPWFWVSLGLAAVLAGLLLSRRHAGTPAAGSAGPAGKIETPIDAEPPSPLAVALERVRDAYRRGDGAAAREALLAWGRLRWPDDPPGNLARLARRFPPPVREHITELEKAFFSPDPIRWEREPVPDALSKDWPGGAAQSGPAPDRAGAAVA